MNKRTKWSESQDEKLKNIINSLEKQKKVYDWEIVSKELKKNGVEKTGKQCRERWFHQLDPNLSKEKWTEENNKLLFDLHKKIGNKWKEIAESFSGRTDNCIKNQFFSLIRKSLRNARKILGKVSNTISVNKIKPKVLSDFLKKKVVLNFPKELLGKNENEEQVIYIHEFVTSFVFNNLHQVLTQIKQRDIFIVKNCMDFLRETNKNYLKKKKIKKEKHRNKINFMAKEKSIGFSRINFQSQIETNIEESQNFKNPFLQNNFKNFPTIQNFLNLENTKKELEKIHNFFINNPNKILTDKFKFSSNLKEISKITFIMNELIQKSSQNEIQKIFSLKKGETFFDYLKNSGFLTKSQIYEKTDKVNFCEHLKISHPLKSKEIPNESFNYNDESEKKQFPNLELNYFAAVNKSIDKDSVSEVPDLNILNRLFSKNLNNQKNISNTLKIHKDADNNSSVFHFNHSFSNL